MLTDLVRIRTLAEAKVSENLDFRRYLSVHAPPPHLFAEIALQVAKEIDCKACANCCRETIVDVTPEELVEISRLLRSSVGQVIHEYTDGGNSLKQTGAGCVFLDGTLCMIYDARPRACREFPHLAFRQATLGGRISSIERNAWMCPIVYNALESLKHALGYQLHRIAGGGCGERAARR